MIDTEVILRKITSTSNSIGVEDDTIETLSVPIIRIEKIYASEFYRANEQGMKPSLRVVINALNFNGAEELEYNGTIYTIIRIEDNIEELALICERKIKNV